MPLLFHVLLEAWQRGCRGFTELSSARAFCARRFVLQPAEDEGHSEALCEASFACSVASSSLLPCPARWPQGWETQVVPESTYTREGAVPAAGGKREVFIVPRTHSSPRPELLSKANLRVCFKSVLAKVQRG